jgi:hypothetical protein
MGVFAPAQRETHVQTTTELIQSVQGVHEVANGYEFTFPNKSALIIQLAEFISNERLCCPCLKFSLNVFSTSEPVSLTLTGPIGTQEFLRAEFNGAIP